MLSRRSAERAHGFTLIELMVAIAILGLLMTYITNTFTMQYQTYAVVDQVSETQNNTLAVAALIERDIRNAGYMVPSSAAACGIDSTSGPDVLVLSDAAAILPVDQLPLSMRGDRLKSEVISVSTSGSTFTVTVDDIVIDGTPSYDTNSDGTDDSDYRIDGAAILVDGANSGRGIACGVVSAVNTGGNSITFDVTSNILSATVTNPQQLWLIPAVVYNVTTPAGSTQPEIQRNGQVLARDVEDLQVAYFFDDNDDGVVDTLEYRASGLNVMTLGGSVAVSPVPSTTFLTNAVDGNLLREIRINIIARTRADDPRNPNSAGAGQARENRTTGIPASDGRRRRVHSATVRLRNIS